MIGSLLLMTALTAFDESLTIRPVDGAKQGGGSVEVSLRLSAEAVSQLNASPNGKLESDRGRQWLTLSAKDRQGKLGPPVFAKYQVLENRLILRPRFPLLPGVSYVATGRVSAEKTVTRSYMVARKKDLARPEVTRIEPSNAKLPANCLKFYIHFSQPMREGKAIFRQVQLLDEEGVVIEAPWRRVELWNDDATRLTMWIHPGRIKQGVNLREDYGPVLKPGRSYRLRVSNSVLSAEGLPLKETYEKRFATVREDHHRPLPQRWRIEAPRVGTRDPLRVHFGESLDHALIQRWLQVQRNNETLAGQGENGQSHASWAFRPDQPWAAGNHRLLVDGRLEDLAGNTPLRAFDNDLQQTNQLSEAPRLSIPFKPLSTREAATKKRKQK